MYILIVHICIMRNCKYMSKCVCVCIEVCIYVCMYISIYMYIVHVVNIVSFNNN